MVLFCDNCVFTLKLQVHHVLLIVISSRRRRVIRNVIICHFWVLTCLAENFNSRNNSSVTDHSNWMEPCTNTAQVLQYSFEMKKKELHKRVALKFFSEPNQTGRQIILIHVRFNIVTRSLKLKYSSVILCTRAQNAETRRYERDIFHLVGYKYLFYNAI